VKADGKYNNHCAWRVNIKTIYIENYLNSEQDYVAYENIPKRILTTKDNSHTTEARDTSMQHVETVKNAAPAITVPNLTLRELTEHCLTTSVHPAFFTAAYCIQAAVPRLYAGPDLRVPKYSHFNELQPATWCPY
jgi:hypothetical protein